jgi:hypothetical protein
MRFAFDAGRHDYIDLDAGEVLPHITGMLEQAGLIDDRWYTEESCERGQVVHRLTADYDLGAIEDVRSVVSGFKPYLEAHVAAMRILRPQWAHVEEPLVSTRYRFGGRPDRVGLVYGAHSVLEVKSGALEAAHAIQTALQAILAGEELHLPPEAINRYGLYLTKAGKFKLEQFIDRGDFDEAHRIIARTCQVAI